MSPARHPLPQPPFNPLDGTCTAPKAEMVNGGLPSNLLATSGFTVTAVKVLVSACSSGPGKL